MVDRQGLFDGMPIHIADSPPPPGTPPTPAGPGIYLDRQEGLAILATLAALREQADNAVIQASSLERMTPPALDPTSRSFNTTAGPGAFAAGVRYLNLQARYLRDLHERLATALGLIESTDRHAGGLITEAGTV